MKRSGLLAQCLMVSILLAVGGCASDPADSVPAAKAPAQKASSKKADAPKAAAAKADAPKAQAEPAAAAAEKQKDAVPAKKPGERSLSGQIEFIGSNVTGSHECIFKTWTGTAIIPADDLTKATFNFAVETASVVADYKNPKPWSKKLERHLRSSDFFHSEANPKATFVSDSVTKGAIDGKGTHVVTGKLTIRGKTKEIVFPATIAIEGGAFKAQAEFSIKRKEFDIIYPGKPDNLIRDRVVLKFDLKG